MVNDDWGFKTQTMISPSQMRGYVVPWHRKITAAGHEAGVPVMMHSCGKLDELEDDIINVIKFDGKHSYEDAIHPVEEAYDMMKGRIAVLGGIDLDFLCRSSVDDIKKRSKAMLDKGMAGGGYALGSGNSIPEYVPDKNFLAMTSVVTGRKY
jgi:uroporphyrinogen decarboxylase